MLAAAAAPLACILCLKLSSVSHLWSPEEHIERGEFPNPTTLRLQIAKELEMSSKAFLTSAIPAGFLNPIDSSPEKPQSQPSLFQPTSSGEALHAFQATASNNSESRHVIVHRAETPEVPLPGPSPTSSSPIRSEFHFWSTEPSLRGWVSEPKGDPDRCGGYSDVWKCGVRFCEPSNLNPIEVGL